MCAGAESMHCVGHLKRHCGAWGSFALACLLQTINCNVRAAGPEESDFWGIKKLLQQVLPFALEAPPCLLDVVVVVVVVV